MPQNEDSQVQISLMQGYREVLEFQLLVGKFWQSCMRAKVGLVVPRQGRPLLVVEWELPRSVGSAGNMLVGHFMNRTKEAEAEVSALAGLRMEADAMHILRETGKVRAYRTAARAYASGRIARQDLANIGIGLTREQREEIGLNVLGEMAS